MHLLPPLDLRSTSSFYTDKSEGQWWRLDVGIIMHWADYKWFLELTSMLAWLRWGEPLFMGYPILLIQGRWSFISSFEFEPGWLERDEQWFFLCLISSSNLNLDDLSTTNHVLDKGSRALLYLSQERDLLGFDPMPIFNRSTSCPVWWPMDWPYVGHGPVCNRLFLLLEKGGWLHRPSLVRIAICSSFFFFLTKLSHYQHRQNIKENENLENSYA